MRIVNAMFGKGLGGIEQASVDYCLALEKCGSEVIALTQPDAKINNLLASKKIRNEQISNFGQWDFIAVFKLRFLLKKEKPDAVIAHGNRAFSLMRCAAKNICPVVAVAHNYNIKRFGKADAVFTITEDLRSKVAELGQINIFHIPNMIDIKNKPETKSFSKPPVIGTMGRFVKKKGFDVFIDALKILKESGKDFKAIIGGTGKEEEALKKQAEGLDIDFCGWVEDKKDFFKNIDIFCLPSHHEPFGIVLLEAFAAHKPVISTNSEGPSEIIENKKDGLLVEKGNAEEMAKELSYFLDNEKDAKLFASHGFDKAQNAYSLEAIGNKMNNVLKEITS